MHFDLFRLASGFRFLSSGMVLFSLLFLIFYFYFYLLFFLLVSFPVLVLWFSIVWKSKRGETYLSASLTSGTVSSHGPSIQDGSFHHGSFHNRSFRHGSNWFAWMLCLSVVQCSGFLYCRLHAITLLGRIPKDPQGSQRIFVEFQASLQFPANPYPDFLDTGILRHPS